MTCLHPVSRGRKADCINRMQVALLAAALGVCVCRGVSAGGRAQDEACEREMIGAAKRYDVPLGVLYAVGLVESGSGRSLHALAVNVEGVAHYPMTGAEALATVRRAQQAGIRLIDVGCMQINLHFHQGRFASLEDMFDPSRNVFYGAAYLSALHKRTRDWTEAVARYHAGPANRPAQARYVCAVIRNLVTVGLGAWTAEARAACPMERKE